jgi:hypothetical protein
MKIRQGIEEETHEFKGDYLGEALANLAGWWDDNCDRYTFVGLSGMQAPNGDYYVGLTTVPDPEFVEDSDES